MAWFFMSSKRYFFFSSTYRRSTPRMEQQQQQRRSSSAWEKNKKSDSRILHQKKHHHRRRSQTSTFRPTCDGRAKQQKIKEREKKIPKNNPKSENRFCLICTNGQSLKDIKEWLLFGFYPEYNNRKPAMSWRMRRERIFSVWSVLCCFMTI